MSSEEQSAWGLRLDRVSDVGKELGLWPGDILVQIDGDSVGGSPHLLKKSVAANSGSSSVLQFFRDGDAWQVLSASAELGRWRRVRLPEDFAASVVRGQNLKNWEIWVGKGRVYDTHPSSDYFMSILVPFNFVRMRLWEPLLFMCALLALCWILGGLVGVAVQTVILIYFWMATPALLRKNRYDRGFRLWRVVAARSEKEVHKHILETKPQLTFVHAAAGKLEQKASSGV